MGEADAACSSGEYQVNDGLTPICRECPAGYECATVTSTPTMCAAGEYSTGGQTSCTACAAGEFCPSIYQAAIDCPDGTYQTAASKTYCDHCPPGYECDASSATACGAGEYSIGNATACITCPEGYFCPNTDTKPQLCPAGYTSSSGADTCTICPTGSMCPTPYNSKIISCPTNYYSGDGYRECIECPVGATCVGASAGVTINYAASLTCSQGNTCYEAEDEAGVDTGYYSIAGVPWQIVCPEGFSCAADGTETRCANGKYSHVGDDSCTDSPNNFLLLDNLQATFIRCPAGTYNPGGESSCLRCPENYECDSDGTSKCPDGYYSPYGLSICLICPPGMMCD